MDIEYRIIADFPDYRVGNDGSVWSKRRSPTHPRRVPKGAQLPIWKKCSPKKARGGYLVVSLWRIEAKREFRFVHRLVLEAFVGKCPPGMLCCHKDGKPWNCTLDNLRWGTQQSNADDMAIHGTRLRGEMCHQAKLKEADVVLARQLSTAGVSRKRLAERFGVTESVIGRAICGATWKHVEGAVK